MIEVQLRPGHAWLCVQAGLQHALLGHFHRPRDAASHTYPGNPDPLTFGEDGPRGAVVITITPDGGLERERRQVGVALVHDLALDVTRCLSLQDLRERVAQALAHVSGVARITLMGEVSPGADIQVRDLGDCAHILMGYSCGSVTCVPDTTWMQSPRSRRYDGNSLSTCVPPPCHRPMSGA